MLHTVPEDTERHLGENKVAGYIGFDPTSDSLHVGSLAQIMTLIHFQRAGHTPYILVGGATGMVGDPSGKSQERNLLSEDILQRNLNGIQSQLQKFLDFDCGKNSAVIVNNYDWFKEYTFLNFIRDVGKHITVNYMMAKDSVKKRLESENGMSFTEFSYQLVQGYDFYYLWKNHNCVLQMGGSDQWGNICTGSDLIHKMGSGEAYALTTNLITKADGSKFGKSEGGNIWLDAEKTSPDMFYQFWIRASDEDAKTYIKIFTLFDRETIQVLELEHNAAPHLRKLQKELAKDITIRVHGESEYKRIIDNIAFFHGNLPISYLNDLDDKSIYRMFAGYPKFEIAQSQINQGIDAATFLSGSTMASVFSSKGEAKRMIQGGGVKINKNKITSPDSIVGSDFLIKNKYMVAQKGSTNFYLITVNTSWLDEVDINTQFWLKPIGFTGHPIPSNHKYNQDFEDLHFHDFPKAVRQKDIFIGYGVGSHKVLSVFRAVSSPKNATLENIEQEWWFERWPWYIKGQNLSKSFGSNWSGYNFNLQLLVKDYLDRNPTQNITLKSKSLGGINFGKDKLNLNPDFAKFIIKKIIETESY